MRRPILHLVALFKAAVPRLHNGELNAGNQHMRFAPFHRGRVGYSGPRALPGHGAHRHGLHLHSLDCVISPSVELTRLEHLVPLVSGRVLAR